MESEFARLNEIKPLLLYCIRESRILLSLNQEPGDEAIHDVRVYMKKARAALKLIHPQLKDASVSKDVFALREVGRRMCERRETAVYRKNLRELRKDFPDLFIRLAGNEHINFLMRKPGSSGLLPSVIAQDLSEIDNLLSKAGSRIRFYSMSNMSPVQLFSELEHTYELVADIYLVCRNYNKPEMLHEFRKKSKDLLYQLFFFRPLSPRRIKAIEKKLGEINRNLGHYNDLTQLLYAIDNEYSTGKFPPELKELVIRIREKQDRYLYKIWPMAFKIFCPGQKLCDLIGYCSPASHSASFSE